jgi:hypothetical protein
MKGLTISKGILNEGGVELERKGERGKKRR